MEAVLICVVGGSPNAIVYSIQAKPEHAHVILVCSTESQSSVAAIREQSGLTDFEIVVVSDAQDLSGCVDRMDRELLPLLSRLVDESGELSITVDLTGGTKCMSAALALVARRWACTFRYIGGDERLKEGLGVVKDHRERVFQYSNPMDSLGHAALEDALTLCHKASYGAAADVLQRACERSSDPAVNKRLASLRQLTQALACWDLFDFKGALGQFQHLEKRAEDLSMALHSDSTRQVMAGLPVWRSRLETLKRAQISRELVEDLLGNAMRRRKERRFDDAVARIYRALEAMAQLRLNQTHGIENTKRVDIQRVPQSVRKIWESRVRPDGTVMLALQDDYSLLRALDDGMGERFESLALNDMKRSPLQSRNRSILAHGFEPVGEGILEQLVKAAFGLAELLNISEADLFQFPDLQRRAG